MKKKIVSMMLISAMAFGLIACGKDTDVADVPSEVNQIQVDLGDTEEDTTDSLYDGEFWEQTNESGQVRSYLTGDWTDPTYGRQRPVACMIENTEACLPQYGISNAGVIYECPVEGSITRMMAVFDDYADLEQIGNVRSSRPYYVYFASEYDAVYCHAGGNPAAFELIDDKDLVDNLNGLDGDLDTSMYYRSSSAKAPHNLYTSGEGILKGIETRGYDMSLPEDYEPHFSFSEENYSPDGEDCAVVELYYYYNHPYWIYNESDGLYYRYEFGDKQIDAGTGEQLTAKNIIIQNVAWWTYAGSEYLGFYLPDTQGTGKFISNGKMVDIVWAKSGDDGMTYYCLDNDNYDLIKLNVGNTWIQVCQEDYSPENNYYASESDFH